MRRQTVVHGVRSEAATHRQNPKAPRRHHPITRDKSRIHQDGQELRYIGDVARLQSPDMSSGTPKKDRRTRRAEWRRNLFDLYAGNLLLYAAVQTARPSRLPLDRVDDVVAVTPVTLGVEADGVVRDVDLVPGRGVASLAANLVRPIRDLGVGDVRAVEQLFRRSLRRRRELISVARGGRTLREVDRSPLCPRRRDSLNERLLRKEEKQYRWQHHERACRHQQMPRRTARFALEVLKA